MKKQHLSRRNFLGTACAALSAPLIVPARALGREGAVAPSERIAMGFIGLGGQGSGHLFGGSWTYVAGGYLGRREVQVQAVCDVWKQRREDAADRVNRHYAHTTGQTSYDGCRAYLDFRELLAREDIDAVLMALPFHWHAPMAILAARAGKDVYSEKPVALTIEEGRLLSNTMRRYARVYQAGTQQRSEAEYGGKFQRAWELIRNGYIGELREIYSFSPGGGFSANMQNTRLKEQPLPEGFDWNLYLGTAPWQPFTGGNVHCGIFAYGDPNWGPHHFDVVQWVLEHQFNGPEAIDYEEDHAVLLYPGGLKVHCCAHPEIEVGATGGACFIGTEGTLAVDREGIMASPRNIMDISIRPQEIHPYKSPIHAGNFLDCIRTRKRTICDAETAYRSMSLVLLAGIATQIKGYARWDARQECFPEHEDANRFLAYARRPEWNI
ncbi:MAG TPA: Gfo/Idh/MocA family oxidoreductase [Candidatus Hydrogenedentes bacterium]|jgi:predicted dehydrogenase|nr:Gfo/Idh/MocA family oxidoreductase [Candidatus Hydrogenedentota bacterium]HOM49278.1 Gfo/Idh/MocA family oxidoreductase [Candidatus Hydrogenedentota bacterium]HOR49795.1 Gfo/Idh/MocA family oxidoreductase [Candidatus Hydrogenedentota bacterium]HPK23760.1 Gfo/Idh/MocA family oxidoreductase [Candidatus Hydrogenedentota bacterium]